MPGTEVTGCFSRCPESHPESSRHADGCFFFFPPSPIDKQGLDFYLVFLYESRRKSRFSDGTALFENGRKNMETDIPELLGRGEGKTEWNPCMSCGACCAVFRASFYRAEAGDATEGGVPVQLTERNTAFRRAMRRTGPPDSRCIALLGTPGQSVRCAIYGSRPSVCRTFDPSWKVGEENPRCNKARARIGLAPRSPNTLPLPKAA
mgnify:CR=1 FL=1